MSYCFRKKSKVVNVTHFKEDKTPQIYLNDKPWVYYEQCCCVGPSFKELLPNLKGSFRITISGGGLGSQVQLVEKILFTFVENPEIKKLIKVKYPNIDRTDERRLYPKKYGGRKARARTQKSYR